MQFPSANKDLLMLAPSLSLAPRLLVTVALSEPAKSMSDILALVTSADRPAVRAFWCTNTCARDNKINNKIGTLCEYEYVAQRSIYRSYIFIGRNKPKIIPKKDWSEGKSFAIKTNLAPPNPRRLVHAIRSAHALFKTHVDVEASHVLFICTKGVKIERWAPPVVSRKINIIARSKDLLWIFALFINWLHNDINIVKN